MSFNPSEAFQALGKKRIFYCKCFDKLLTCYVWPFFKNISDLVLFFPHQCLLFLASTYRARKQIQPLVVQFVSAYGTWLFVWNLFLTNRDWQSLLYTKYTRNFISWAAAAFYLVQIYCFFGQQVIDIPPKYQITPLSTNFVGKMCFL